MVGWQGNNREKMENHYAWREDPRILGGSRRRRGWCVRKLAILVGKLLRSLWSECAYTLRNGARGRWPTWSRARRLGAGAREDGQHGHSAPTGGLVRGEEGHVASVAEDVRLARNQDKMIAWKPTRSTCAYGRRRWSKLF